VVLKILPAVGTLRLDAEVQVLFGLVTVNLLIAHSSSFQLRN
jgi:hypothetical protein